MVQAVLTLLMHRDLDTGEWYIDRIDTEFQNLRNQVRFVTPAPIRFALSESFATFLSEHLPVRLSPSITSIDHAWVEGTNLGLNGVRVIAQRALSGIQSVTIKVQDYTGKLTNLLSSDTLKKFGTAMGLQVGAKPTHLAKDTGQLISNIK